MMVKARVIFLVTGMLGFGSVASAGSPAGNSCYGSGNNPDAAIRVCTEMLEAGRGTPAIIYNDRGVVWNDKGEYDRALDDYNKAIELNPRYYEAYNNRGVVRYSMGDYDGAIADYDRAIDQNAKFDQAYRNRGMAWRRKGACDRAAADYGKAIALNPQYYKAFNGLAWIKATCKDHSYRNGDEAVRLVKRVLTIKGDLAYLDTLAAAYVEADRPDKAVETYERVMTLDDRFVVNYQKDLKKKGYLKGAVDGKYGPMTRAALVACIKAGCQMGVE